MYMPQPMPFMPSQPQQQYDAAHYQPPPPSTSIPQVRPEAEQLDKVTGTMHGFAHAVNNLVMIICCGFVMIHGSTPISLLLLIPTLRSKDNSMNSACQQLLPLED
jgi:hypothetical protein